MSLRCLVWRISIIRHPGATGRSLTCKGRMRIRVEWKWSSRWSEVATHKAKEGEDGVFVIEANVCWVSHANGVKLAWKRSKIV